MWPCISRTCRCSRPVNPWCSASISTTPPPARPFPSTCWARAVATSRSPTSASSPNPWNRTCWRPSRIRTMKRSPTDRSWAGRLLGPHPQPQQLAVRLVGQHIEVTVRPLAHIADTRPQPFQQALLMHHLVPLQLETNQGLRSEGGDKKILPPGREAFAGVEGHTADRRGFRPDMQWRLGAFGRRAYGFGNRQKGIVDAMGRQWPTVVLAGQGFIDFIAATRAVLVGPELAGPGVQRRALRVAMAVGPDFRARTGACNERVVRRHSPIRVQANDLALQLVEVLGGRPLVVFPPGDKEITAVVDHQPRTKMRA